MIGNEAKVFSIQLSLGKHETDPILRLDGYHDRLNLEAIERRKAEGEDTFDSCDGTGLAEAAVCLDCLGQGVLLYQEEYEALLRMSGHSKEDILDAEFIEL